MPPPAGAEGAEGVDGAEEAGGLGGVGVVGGVVGRWLSVRRVDTPVFGRPAGVRLDGAACMAAARAVRRAAPTGSWTCQAVARAIPAWSTVRIQRPPSSRTWWEATLNCVRASVVNSEAAVAAADRLRGSPRVAP